MFLSRITIGHPQDTRLVEPVRESRWKRQAGAVKAEIGTFPAEIYFDSIGIPRGVPDKYKLIDQIAGGFESMFCWWCTINKNVDRINFVHYNVMYQANLSRAAVDLLNEELEANTRMTYQNRVALDMLYAEKGGVCTMFGDECCTIIPNNTGPLGPLQDILNKMRDHSQLMQEASGVNNPLSGVLDKWFGKWKTMLMTVLSSVMAVTGLLIMCGCCWIPCLRTLSERLITQALSKEGGEIMLLQLRPQGQYDGIAGEL